MGERTMKTIGLSLLLTAGFLSTIMGMEGMWGIAAPLDMFLTIVGNCVCIFVICELLKETH